MRYYISDLHFYHDNLNHRMDNRGFENAEAMNEYMIKLTKNVFSYFDFGGFIPWHGKADQ